MKRPRRPRPLDIVADMDLMAMGLIRTARTDKAEGGKIITLGERLRIFDGVTKWIVAKNRLDDRDERVGIDALKARLRGGAASESDADSGTLGADRTSGRAGRLARYTPDRTKGGPELDRIKRRLPDSDRRRANGRSRDHGDAHSTLVGSDGSVDTGDAYDPGPEPDEAGDERDI